MERNKSNGFFSTKKLGHLRASQSTQHVHKRWGRVTPFVMLPWKPVTTAAGRMRMVFSPPGGFLATANRNFFQELPGDPETRDEATPPPPSPGVLENILLTRDGLEDLNTKLQLCNDQSFPDCLEFAPAYLPYYRTTHVFISPPSLCATSHISVETEEGFSEDTVNTKNNEKGSHSAISTGYFPYYRTSEELLGQPLTYGLNVEGKKPDNDGKDENEGDAETTTPPSLELDKRALPSTTQEEPPAHQFLRDPTSEHSLSMISCPSLNQPFSSSGYYPYYRTEGKLCADPALGERFFSETEGWENKERGQGEETGFWHLGASCLMC